MDLNDSEMGSPIKKSNVNDKMIVALGGLDSSNSLRNRRSTAVTNNNNGEKKLSLFAK